MSKNNPCSKTRELDNPYEVWECSTPFGVVEYRVLKKYQSPKKEAENSFARWFTAAKSEATFGRWEYGDIYVRDIVSTGRRLS
jgi:hypothetical protein